jgi:hypothetical protein
VDHPDATDWALTVCGKFYEKDNLKNKDTFDRL